MTTIDQDLGFPVDKKHPVQRPPTTNGLAAMLEMQADIRDLKERVAALEEARTVAYVQMTHGNPSVVGSITITPSGETLHHA